MLRLNVLGSLIYRITFNHKMANRLFYGFRDKKSKMDYQCDVLKEQGNHVGKCQQISKRSIIRQVEDHFDNYTQKSKVKPFSKDRKKIKMRESVESIHRKAALQMSELVRKWNLIEQLGEIGSKQSQYFTRELQNAISGKQSNVRQIINILSEICLLLSKPDQALLSYITVKMFLSVYTEQFVLPYSYQIQVYERFIQRYGEQIILCLRNEQFKFIGFINLYRLLDIDGSGNEVKNGFRLRVWQIIMQNISFCDLSLDENFDVMIGFLLQKKKRLLQHQKQFFRVLSGQISFFPLEKMKKCLMVVCQFLQECKSSIIMSFLDVMILNIEMLIEQFDSKEWLFVLGVIFQLGNKRIECLLKRDEVFGYYFKKMILLINQKVNHGITLSFIIKVVSHYGEKIDYTSYQQQPELAELLFRYISLEIKNALPSSQGEIKEIFDSIYELIQLLVSREIFEYECCQKQFQVFTKQLNKIISRFYSLQSHRLMIFLKQGIKTFQNRKLLIISSKLKRLSPKKIYSFLNQAVINKNIQLVQTILKIILDPLYDGFFPHIRLYSSYSVEFSNVFENAVQYLISIQQVSIFKEVLLTQLTKTIENSKITNVIMKTFLQFPQLNIWNIYFQSWLQVYNERKDNFRVIHYFFRTLEWFISHEKDESKILSNCNFYEIIRQISNPIIKKIVFDKKSIINFYQLINYLISPVYQQMLMSSLLTEVIKRVVITPQIDGLIGDFDIRQFQVNLIRYKLRNGFNKEQSQSLLLKISKEYYDEFSEANRLFLTYYVKNNMNRQVSQKQIDLCKQNVFIFVLRADMDKNSEIYKSVIEILELCTPLQLFSILYIGLEYMNNNLPLIRIVWNLFLQSQIDFKYISWQELLPYSRVQNNFDEFKLFILKIMEYYTKYPYLLSRVSQRFLIEILINKRQLYSVEELSVFIQTYGDYFIQNKFYHKRQLKYSLIKKLCQLGYKPDEKILKKLGFDLSIVENGFYMVQDFEQCMQRERFECFLKYFFQSKIKSKTNFFKRQFNQIQIFLLSKYKGVVQQLILKLKLDRKMRRDSNYIQMLKSVEISLYQNYQYIEINKQYTFIIHKDTAIVFAKPPFVGQRFYFMTKLRELVPELKWKSIKMVNLSKDNTYDLVALQQEIGLKKSTQQKIYSKISINDSDIQDLQLQLKLSEQISKIQLDNDQRSNLERAEEEAETQEQGHNK